MIAKTSLGRSFPSLSTYLLQEFKNPEILLAKGVFIKDSTTIANDFIEHANSMSRSKCQKVWHTSISFSYKDQVDNELMTKVGLEFCKKLGLDNTQLLFVKHNDKEHQHFHIMANRVDNVGKLIDAGHFKMRGIAACRELEKEFNLDLLSNYKQVEKSHAQEHFEVRQMDTHSVNIEPKEQIDFSPFISMGSLFKHDRTLDEDDLMFRKRKKKKPGINNGLSM